MHNTTEQIGKIYTKAAPTLSGAKGSDLVALSTLLIRFAFEVTQELDARLKEKV